jgi:hypothetical protein
MSSSQWQRTLDAIEEAQKQMVALARSDEDVPSLVRQAVAGGNPFVRWLLPRIDEWRPGVTLSAANQLLDRALAERSVLQVRQTLGAMHHAEVERVISPLVMERLGDPNRPDADWEYLRYAELLEHLGLDHALGQLIARARTSSDPEVRDIADDVEARAKRPLAW